MDFLDLARRTLLAGAALTLLGGVLGCDNPPPTPELQGQVHLTLIHTADIHSRLFPYNLQLSEIDSGLGLGASGSIVNTGGASRVSHIIGRERARSDRVLHLDGGDSFEGAPVFNFYSGEAEVRTLSAMGTDASLIANHEFDKRRAQPGDSDAEVGRLPRPRGQLPLRRSVDPGQLAARRHREAVHGLRRQRPQGGRHRHGQPLEPWPPSSTSPTASASPRSTPSRPRSSTWISCGRWST